MNLKPEVSVIIPCFNSSGSIKTAVESVLEHTGFMVEIIVVDDGSADRPDRVLENYIEKGLVTYLRQENKGPAAARNLGIKNAKGEYICFLDADDTLQVNSIQDRLAVYKKYPELGLLFTDYKKVIRENGTEVTWRENDLLCINFLESIASNYIRSVDGDIYLFHKGIFHELVLFCFIWTGTVMIPRKVFSDVGYFNESLRIAEDHDLWLRIARKYDIGYRDINTATYVLHDGGITKNIILYYNSSIMVRSQYLDPMYGLPKEYREKLRTQVASHFFTKGYFYYNKGSYGEARKEFRQAINYDQLQLRYFLYLVITFLPDSAIKKIRKWHSVMIQDGQE
jgi:glycosyltransferase involved in cell wall biosynthesis